MINDIFMCDSNCRFSHVVDVVTGTVQISVCCSTSWSSESVTANVAACGTPVPGTCSRFCCVFFTAASPLPGETVRSLFHLMRATRSRMDFPTIFTSQSRKNPDSTYRTQVRCSLQLRLNYVTVVIQHLI